LFVAEPWNVNVYYDSRLDDCVPPRAASVLEVVGCGPLFGRSPVNTSAERRRCGHRWAGAWAGQAALPPRLLWSGCAATSSSCQTSWGLRRRRHVRPPWLAPLAMALATLVIRGVAIRLRSKWEHSAPTVWPPRYTVAELRRHVRGELPGARVSLFRWGASSSSGTQPA